ncbi:radical SAM protein [Vibrio parahaemolyticus]|uniref:radical SAM protein n=1 Tax=Vibrio parahaemolyticus TaxID=670 RepID=UPI00084A4DBA|nr:radical SAM protein [Vibrio parahaemolyticus]MCU8156185.1 radical SAM protein [Vibrio vulnificus]EGQ9271268.1 radical SAM protein [Vibrio parahaemolyticus]EGQ9707741.1 radical SAM protein [Vibrio parahaemolyticus]EIA0902483.1 radical SAM protein [Vibrio parahaemolyticus]EID0733243.1 radical SAM protein [Vibrio parahaemolyticus]
MDDVYKKIMFFDLSIPKSRFAANSRYGNYSNDLEIEFKRFLYLNYKNPGVQLAPSPMVDEFWHFSILDTKTYQKLCMEIFGKLLHHDVDIPSSNNDIKKIFDDAYNNTLSLYEKVFEVPNSLYWPKENDLIKKYKTPHRIHLETTKHCNLRCEHCYPESGPEHAHHELEVILDMLKKAKEEGAEKVTLTGGEIFTRKDWKEIISFSIKNFDNVYFISNGLKIKEEMLSWIAKQKVKKTMHNFFIKRKFVTAHVGLAISLDGLEGNKLVRVNGAGRGVEHHKILDKITLAVNYGLHVTVNTTITNEKSASEIYPLYLLLKDIGIDRWQLDQAYLSGRYTNSQISTQHLSWLETTKQGYFDVVKDYLKNYPTLPNFRLEIVQVFRYDILEYGYTTASSLNEHPCAYQYGTMVIEDGDKARFCPSLRHEGSEIGEYKGSYFEVMSSNKSFEKFSKLKISDLPCKDCRYALVHHGGCRANSSSYTGKLIERDPICCSLSPFVEEKIVPLLPPKLQKQFFDALNGPNLSKEIRMRDNLLDVVVYE